MPKCEPVIDAVFKLLQFTKNHEFPEKDTDEFFELTQLLDDTETMLLKYNWIGPNAFRFRKEAS